MRNNVRTLVLCGAMGALVAGCASVRDVSRARSRAVRADEHRCLALTMYHEARGEGEEGMLAVGAVVLNRTMHRAFPDNPCAVVTQGGETPPCQFEWWCDGRSDEPREVRSWQAALSTAEHMLRGRAQDFTRGAWYFHSTRILPRWAHELEVTRRIGNHVFYR